MSQWTVDYVKDNGVQYMLPAFRAMFRRDPNFYELAFALLQSHHESSWGRGWKPPCDTSHNWGAVQSRTNEGCQYADSGPSGAYAQKFVVYPDHEAGAAGYLKEAYGRRPKALARAGEGDLEGFVRELYASTYFTGIRCLEKAPSGKCLKIDHEGNISDYLKSLERRRPDVEHALEAMGFVRPPPSLTSSPLAPYGALAVGLAAGGGLAVALRPTLRARGLVPNPRRARAAVTPSVLLTAGVALLGAATLAWLLTRRRVPTSGGVALRQGDRVLLIGDSLAVGLAPHLSRIAQDAGVPFASAAASGSTMQHWLHAAAAPMASVKPTLVLVSLGTNDAMTSQSLLEMRSQRDQLLSKLGAAGARVLWVGPPRLPERARRDVLEMLAELHAYFHSEELPIPQHDGIHSTPDGYRDWAVALWQSMGGS